jgi:drug/metabolite transporter (DMT)-like permease
MRRRFGSTDAILVLTVVIWALNVTVTKYILEHGFQPLAFTAVRYGLAAAIFTVMTLALERSLRIRGRAERIRLGVGAIALYLNQLCFVYALTLTSATTVALLLGTLPVFSALLSSATGLEKPTRRFWLAAGVSFGGVAVLAGGSGGDLAGDLGGVLVALGMAATWSVYSVAVAPVMGTYSPFRISAVVMTTTWALVALTAAPQLAEQDRDLGGLVWVGLAYAVAGPLVLTTILWFVAIHRVGPSRAALYVNLQPFLGAIFAVVLLSEPLPALDVAGGALIAAGILLAGRPAPVPAPSE